MIWPQQPKNFPIVWKHTATGVKFCNVFREVCNRRANHEVISVEAKKALDRTLERKCKASEVQEGVSRHK